MTSLNLIVTLSRSVEMHTADWSGSLLRHNLPELLRKALDPWLKQKFS